MRPRAPVRLAAGWRPRLWRFTVLIVVPGLLAGLLLAWSLTLT